MSKGTAVLLTLLTFINLNYKSLKIYVESFYNKFGFIMLLCRIAFTVTLQIWQSPETPFSELSNGDTHIQVLPALHMNVITCWKC